MNPRPLLAAGRDLVHWARQGGRPDRVPPSVLWLYRWRALWLEPHFALLRGTGPGTQPFPFPEGEGLIFILGFWRSGTTLLHELLTEAPGCGAPRTWQCMDPSALLLSRGKASSGAIQRPMDRVLVSNDSPQEDEFALMAMGVPSVYRGFLDPRRLPELEALLDPGFWSSSDTSWLKSLECFLSWCRRKDQARMVVKSPNHLFRYRALAARYPRARFLWILRSPQELWRSNVVMWRAMAERYGLWNAPGGEIEDFLGKALSAYGDLIGQLQAEGVFREQSAISYEALVASPEAVLRPLADRLGLDAWEPWGPAILSRIEARPAPQDRPVLAPDLLLDHVKALQDSILLER